MTYTDLKTMLSTALLKTEHKSSEELLKDQIIKEEVLSDLLRFMVFFEELEQKIQEESTELKKHQPEFKKILKYLNTLNEYL